MQNEPGWMTQAMTALGVVVTGISAWAWKHTHPRIDSIDDKTHNYVTNEAFMQHTKTRKKFCGKWISEDCQH
jgi:hypothetical protein